MNLYEKYTVYITLVYLLYVVFQKAFAIALDVWDDDGGNFLGIGKADDLVDVTSSNVGNVPAQKDFAECCCQECHGTIIGHYRMDHLDNAFLILYYKLVKLTA